MAKRLSGWSHPGPSGSNWDGSSETRCPTPPPYFGNIQWKRSSPDGRAARVPLPRQGMDEDHPKSLWSRSLPALTQTFRWPSGLTVDRAATCFQGIEPYGRGERRHPPQIEFVQSRQFNDGLRQV